MKMSILIFTLACSLQVCAQNGSLQLKLAATDKNVFTTLAVSCWKDSICLGEYKPDESGTIRCKELPIGKILLHFSMRDSLIWTQEAFIQENQLFHLPIYLLGHKLNNATQYDVNEVGNPSQQAVLKSQLAASSSGRTLFMGEVKEIEMVSCVAYKIPLLQNTGNMTNTITRNDIQRMPVRSAQGIAATIGGVNSIEGTNDLHIRGGRSEGTVYYLDGARVASPMNIPKSAISEVIVYNGGMPANYGDATGGIIAVETIGSSSRLNQTNYTAPKITYKEPEPELNYDHFLPIYENDFLAPGIHAHSTFGIDVDRASWSYIKRAFQNGQTISRDAVKLEEMINSFRYEFPKKPQSEAIDLELKRSSCAWSTESELVSIHLKAMNLPADTKRKAFNLVFLIDVSGSMTSEDKLPLLVEGLKQFVRTLRADDRVSIVTYAGISGIALPPTQGSERQIILNALDQLSSGGSTNGIGGIATAYELAEKNYNPDFNNRIILATDGDFNVGINSTGDLEKYISAKRGKGIYLTALGFGMGNYKNSILETLADRGDGNHFYISSLRDCEQVLSGDIGNLINLARDVKIDVQFNPNLVREYRLIGYENRLLKPEDFVDDKKDGGEIGYGHHVVAVYEIKRGKSLSVPNDFLQTTTITDQNKLAIVKLRYKMLEDSSSVERAFELPETQAIETDELLNLVISFGLLLRDSAFKGDMNFAKIKQIARDYSPKNEDEKELLQLINKLN